MLKDEFEKLYNEYDQILAPIIAKIINDNCKYCKISEKIKWGWNYDQNLSIMATCDRNNNLIQINLFSVIKAYKEKLLIIVEYFVVHEIRHIFQNIKIKEHKAGICNDINSNLVEKWIYENEHYEKALDINNNENPKYFMQNCEIDAYAFSYALMKHKYKDVSYLYVPQYYGAEFYNIVNDWLECFKNEIEN